MNKEIALISIALLLTMPLMLAWQLFETIENKVDWFLFIDFMQSPKWYVLYSSYHLDRIIYGCILVFMVRKYIGSKESLIPALFLIISIYRMFDYWAFRGHSPAMPILIYSIFGVILILCYIRYSKSNEAN